MLLSLNWLSDFLKINKSAKEIADKITLSLSEVEKIIKVGDDWVLEIENKALTHRPDCFSQVGLATEVAAFFNLPLNLTSDKYPEPDLKNTKGKLPLTVKIKNSKLVNRYEAVVLTNIKVSDSPAFIKKRLKSCNVRPINNVVDITNYVMLELGQPLHAFSYDKISKKQIIIRNAKKNEKIVTIDEVTQNLDEDMTVIADGNKAVALAGIMGGKDSEITKNTTVVVLESANFNPLITRQTSKKLGLRTEAVTRFEKGLDPNLTHQALLKAVFLLKKYAGAAVSSKIIDLYTNKKTQTRVETSGKYINSLLGLSLTANEIVNLLQRLQLRCKVSGDKILVTVPTYRRDLVIDADIAEEVARIYGYDNIPTTLPQGLIKPPPSNASLVNERKIKLFLSSIGFAEAPLSSFIGKENIKYSGSGEETYLKLLNPIAEEKKYLRKSLLPGLLFAAKANLRYFNSFSLFDIGRIFKPKLKGELPLEQKKLAGILVGKSYFEVKGVVEAIFEFLSIGFPAVTKSDNHTLYHKEASAKIPEYGNFGEVSSTVLDFLNTKKNVSVFEIDFDLLVKHSAKVNFYKPIPEHPPVIEDFSFIFSKDIKIGNVINYLKKIDPIINSIEIINEYETTYTFRLTFLDPKKPLTKADIIPVRKKITAGLKKEFNAVSKGLGS